MSRQEHDEADYCIITPPDKKDIVLMQLEDLKANNPSEENISWQVYDFDEDVVDAKAAILKCGICKGASSYTSQKKQSAIIIKFPQSVLDKSAVQNELDCSLTNHQARYFVKAPFDQAQSKRFNQFDASTRLECIEEFLALELDFE